MRIIAFDLGSNLAWAYHNKSSISWGCRLFAGHRTVRLAAMMTFVNALLKTCTVDAVAYETPFARGYHATRSMWGSAGVLEACATKAGLPIIDVSVATIKKFATGDGHAPKNAMVAAAASRWKYTGKNDNEADAICLLKYAEANLEYGEK